MKYKMKKLAALLLALTLTVVLAACGGVTAEPEETSETEVTDTPETEAPETTETEPDKASEEPVELVVFAAASMTETLNAVAEQYKTVAPNVNLVFTFDSSGTLKTQIEEGAVCDIFISAAQKQMNQLDASKEDGLDFVLQGTRVDLVENKVTLAVPEGNPAGVEAFEDVATDKVKLIALGNSDVPVGQYSEELYTHLGVWDQIQDKISFGSNVKEVTTWVSENTVDCGVVYATDAFSAGLEVVAVAPAEWMTNQVIYPAAVLKQTRYEDAARAFVDYLTGGACDAIFEAVGFTMCE